MKHDNNCKHVRSADFVKFENYIFNLAKDNTVCYYIHNHNTHLPIVGQDAAIHAALTTWTTLLGWSVKRVQQPQDACIKIYHYTDIVKAHFKKELGYTAKNDGEGGRLAWATIEDYGGALYAHIFIDPNEELTLELEFGKIDLQALMTHEFGHTIFGLDHTNKSGNVMQPFFASRRILGEDDKAGALAKKTLHGGGIIKDYLNPFNDRVLKATETKSIISRIEGVVSDVLGIQDDFYNKGLQVAEGGAVESSASIPKENLLSDINSAGGSGQFISLVGLARRYGRKVSYDLLSPDGDKWSRTASKVDAALIREAEKGSAKNFKDL